MEVSGELQAPADLPLAKKSRRRLLDRKQGGPENRYERCGVKEHFLSSRNQTSAVQQAARRYTD
jgi:hypothetical protein